MFSFPGVFCGITGVTAETNNRVRQMIFPEQRHHQTKIFNVRCLVCAGFSLLEVMVAITILGVALVVIMQLFSIGLKSALVEKEYTQAIFLAKTKMGEVLVGAEFEEGTDSGTFENGYEWQVSIEPFEGLDDEENPSSIEVETSLDKAEKQRFSPYEITLVVRWGRETHQNKNVTLKSLRIIKGESEEKTY
ncbi:prepilin-type N-terminal cleavage/methylation domain-containing protein [candidate division CSSED10-310 bacterium]|uniref:Prepilin-type N-terminal cleavage/methylation domain-containing protein n=1 Tax=candidate division CSSED10-310 bacterium TaxID=2855610 RepID=A0ABV6YZG4_UNCC1